MKHAVFYPILLISAILCNFFAFPISFAAELNVGVKVGDWMEYGVSYTGLPELGASFFGYEIIQVDNSVLTITGTTNYSNGTIETENYIVDIFKNSFRDFDGFIIPAPINKEESSFYSGDENIGDLIIDSFESREYNSINRDVVIVNFSRNDASSTYFYDISFGVLVEYQRFESNYSLEVKLEKTNLWSPEILRFNPMLLYGAIIAVVATIIIIVILLMKRKK